MHAYAPAPVIKFLMHGVLVCQVLLPKDSKYAPILDFYIYDNTLIPIPGKPSTPNPQPSTLTTLIPIPGEDPLVFVLDEIKT